MLQHVPERDRVEAVGRERRLFKCPLMYGQPEGAPGVLGRLGRQLDADLAPIVAAGGQKHAGRTADIEDIATAIAPWRPALDQRPAFLQAIELGGAGQRVRIGPRRRGKRVVLRRVVGADLGLRRARILVDQTAVGATHKLERAGQPQQQVRQCKQWLRRTCAANQTGGAFQDGSISNTGLTELACGL